MGAPVTFDQFINALNKLQLCPLKSDHVISQDSRLVHDLGIAGDDLEELLQLLDLTELTPKQVTGLRVANPAETSRDAYLVSMASSWLSVRFPWLVPYFVRQLKAPAFTVREFLDLVSVSRQ